MLVLRSPALDLESNDFTGQEPCPLRPRTGFAPGHPNRHIFKRERHIYLVTRLVVILTSRFTAKKERKDEGQAGENPRVLP
jgi:hypothetical protein